MKPRKPGRPPVIDWSKWDKHLGTIVDTLLARAIGCSTHAVLARRRRLVIRAYQPRWGAKTTHSLR